MPKSSTVIIAQTSTWGGQGSPRAPGQGSWGAMSPLAPTPAGLTMSAAVQGLQQQQGTDKESAQQQGADCQQEAARQAQVLLPRRGRGEPLG